MSPEEQEAAVRELMLAGGTNKSVAEELGTTPNAIAGLRHRKKIPSTRSPGKEKKPKEKKATPKAKPKAEKKAKPKAEPKPKAVVPPPMPPPEPVPEPVVEPPQAAAARPEPAPQPTRTHKPATEPHDPHKYKLAATEATQCLAHDDYNRRCGYEKIPGSDYCRLPQHQQLAKNMARR